ncbi:hypothetical protein TWF694_003005 [Orbilia ellipsospora]|uniref:CRAL-TRIO domain-containing protein n=1 Tax=Orbilia ellipsospora TaxID=2528407 RepID=A0AAV9X0A3_9PEZI
MKPNPVYTSHSQARIHENGIRSGSIEHLTPDEELKLQEFWAALLILFKISTDMMDTAMVSNNHAYRYPISPKKSPKLILSPRFHTKQTFVLRNGSKNSIAAPYLRLLLSHNQKRTSRFDIQDTEAENLKLLLETHRVENFRLAFWQFVKHENPDRLILQFLRVSSWNVDKALDTMVSAIQWRIQIMHVESIVKGGELAASISCDKGFISQLRSGKAYIHSTDKEDRPICIISAKNHKPGEQSIESLERFTVYLMETTRLLRPDWVDNCCMLFDMTGFESANMDYTAIKFIARCLETRFPETMGICIIHNTPWGWQGILKALIWWMTPILASKVYFTSGVDELTQYIDKSNIPEFLGGDEKWRYSYSEPSPSENSVINEPSKEVIEERQKLEAIRWDIIKQYEENTLLWVTNEFEGNYMVMDLHDERRLLREDLKLNYWALDRFLRARTYYDRIGMLERGGEINYHPWKRSLAAC